MKRYVQQQVVCKHCEGKGKVPIDWEDYVFLRLPDRLRESLDSLNYKGERELNLDWKDIAEAARLTLERVEQILNGTHLASLIELYQLADALQVKLKDLLPLD